MAGEEHNFFVFLNHRTRRKQKMLLLDDHNRSLTLAKEPSLFRNVGFSYLRIWLVLSLYLL